MTLEELDKRCAEREQMSRNHGLDPGGGHLVLTRPGWAKGHRASLAPGLIGTCVANDRRPDGSKYCVIDVTCGDVRKWLNRRIPTTTEKQP